MDFDQMFEAWRAQNTAPPFDVNRDALRQALQAEEARFQQEMRTRRRGLWFAGLVGAGMAIWAGFWIAITITNRWPSIFAITSALSLVLFALGAGSLWMSRGREPKQNFDNTIEGEVRRSLAYVDVQLSLANRWILPMLGTAFILVATGLFNWTINRSQDIPDSSPIGWSWWTFFVLAFLVWASLKSRDEMRRSKAKFELRQTHLRAVLAALERGE